MSGTMNNDGAHGFVSAPKTLFTHDEERVEHIISEETLMELARGGQDRSLEIAIGAAGVAFGYFQNFASAIGRMEAAEPLSRWEAAGAGIFIISATAAIIFLAHYRKNGTRLDDLLTRIKSRKVGRMAEPGTPYVGGEPVPESTAMEQVSASTTE